MIDFSAERETLSLPTADLPSEATIVDGRIIVSTNLGQVESFAPVPANQENGRDGLAGTSPGPLGRDAVARDAMNPVASREVG